MFGRVGRNAKKASHAACSGCSLCLLVCPAWRSTHDPRLTPEGRAKALQHGATAEDVRASVEACTLCGACEPVCPERIDLVGMTLDLRMRLVDAKAVKVAQAGMRARVRSNAVAARTLLLAGPSLLAKEALLARIEALLGARACPDDGADIAQALAAGVPVPPERLAEFLAGLRHAKRLVVEDGAWMRHLRVWLPKTRIAGLGEALSSLAAVRRGLRSTDLYVIEPRAYHGDYARLVGHYDRLRAERGCAFNLDLQRIAIPAHGQAGWILKGLSVDRVVVERQEDAAAFEALGAHAVVHIAELADH